jgi:hypothetical protein
MRCFLPVLLILIAPVRTVAERVSVWSLDTRSIPITPQEVNFGSTINEKMDDPIHIHLLARRHLLGHFRIYKEMKSIYDAAKRTGPAGFLFGEVAEFLVQDSRRRWFYVWYELRPQSHSSLMIFPAVQIAEKPPLFSATGYGQSYQNDELAGILRPLLKKGKPSWKMIREWNRSERP